MLSLETITFMSTKLEFPLSGVSTDKVLARADRATWCCPPIETPFEDYDAGYFLQFSFSQGIVQMLTKLSRTLGAPNLRMADFTTQKFTT